MTAGTYDDQFLGWPGRACRIQAQKGHDISLYNLGVRAETTEQIRARWRAECEPRLPADFDGRLVMSFGVNDPVELADGSLRVEKDRSIANARAMIEEAKTWKPVLWISPVPTPDLRQPFHPSPDIFYNFSTARCAEYNAAYKDLAAELDVPYLDVFSALAADARWAAVQQDDGDGVHPPGAGYEMIAALVDGWDAWQAWFAD
jgi:lysophospholipase L1-like esterase